jgi:hypothetical protein
MRRAALHPGHVPGYLNAFRKIHIAAAAAYAEIAFAEST